MTKNNTLILTPFKQAVASLEKALAQPKNEFTLDATIQRFEYTFELAWKMLKRYLKIETGTDEYNIKNIFREAGKQSLINNVDQWFFYHKTRNLTTHTHNETTADNIYEAAKQFLNDAKSLLKKLQQLCEKIV